MGTRELLSYLEKLEIGLSNFSYEELGTVEAGELKKSFDYFKSGLEGKVFGAPELEQLDRIYDEVGIEKQTNRDPENQLNEIKLLFSLIDSLQETQLSNRQRQIVESLKKINQRLLKTKVHQSVGEKNIQRSKTPQNLSIEKDFENISHAEKLNLKHVLVECMGEMELLEELVRLYKQNIFEFIGSFKTHLQARNFIDIESACKKIQPSLRMMNTVSLLEIANQIISVCKTDNDIKHLNFLYDQFLMEYPKIEEMVDFEIAALKNM
ncbi:hypothetical protein HME9304_03097 [Flagellimonas maritima]|uniref:Uncharacterized protein n=1 Tax=Flagellimonas maritima TaxID=1383885 RepID=A0A2Z4LVU1_9FLAO|nr:hypothetical protein [Allomuricauda aurantiaca]AWX46065.1 hypothetical protein HME9304_03097 [Allomuricauda aurantiaca]